MSHCELSTRTVLLMACLSFSLTSCSKDMAIQDRLTAQNHLAPSPLANTITSPLLTDSGEYLGPLTTPHPANEEVASIETLNRGRERYEIHCGPCHDRSGAGRGIVVERGFKQPKDLASEEVRRRTDQDLYNIITDGIQTMAGYRRLITSEDRKAITAYLRVLQLARAMPVGELELIDREALNKETSQ